MGYIHSQIHLDLPLAIPTFLLFCINFESSMVTPCMGCDCESLAFYMEPCKYYFQKRT